MKESNGKEGRQLAEGVGGGEVDIENLWGSVRLGLVGGGEMSEDEKKKKNDW